MRGINSKGTHARTKMLSLIILLLAASSSAELLPPESRFHCPDLSPESVCTAANSGFDYNDGCNGVVCSGDGRASTTLMACQLPDTPAERRHCERLARAVWRRLGPFTCPNIHAETVCNTRGPGFAFSDGCNRIRCTKSGLVSTSVHCAVTDPEGPFCRFAAAALAEPEAPSESRAAGPAEEEKFECPNLHYGRVCAEFLPGFIYHDGCRQVRCVAEGLARLPAAGDRDCPEPEPGNAAATAYCQDAERRMLEKKARSSFFTTCLQADQVCKVSRTAELAFHDGCNRCYCLPDRNAACTRVACPTRFETPEEFAEHCKRVGAGALPEKK